MRILLASSELHPYSKTGGLADMVAALGKTLARKGHRVGVVTPLYAGVRERVPGLKKLSLSLTVALGGEEVHGAFWTLEPSAGLTVYFVEQEQFFHRKDLYGEAGRRVSRQRGAVHLLLEGCGAPGDGAGVEARGVARPRLASQPGDVAACTI